MTTRKTIPTVTATANATVIAKPPGGRQMRTPPIASPISAMAGKIR